MRNGSSMCNQHARPACTLVIHAASLSDAVMSLAGLGARVTNVESMCCEAQQVSLAASLAAQRQHSVQQATLHTAPATGAISVHLDANAFDMAPSKLALVRNNHRSAAAASQDARLQMRQPLQTRTFPPSSALRQGAAARTPTARGRLATRGRAQMRTRVGAHPATALQVVARKPRGMRTCALLPHDHCGLLLHMIVEPTSECLLTCTCSLYEQCMPEKGECGIAR